MNLKQNRLYTKCEGDSLFLHIFLWYFKNNGIAYSPKIGLGDFVIFRVLCAGVQEV